MIATEKQIRDATRSTDFYPGMEPTNKVIDAIRESHPAKERLFVVLRKGMRFEEVRAENCQIHDCGALIFTTGGSLVKAIAAGSWAEIEEGEDE